MAGDDPRAALETAIGLSVRGDASGAVALVDAVARAAPDIAELATTRAILAFNAAAIAWNVGDAGGAEVALRAALGHAALPEAAAALGDLQERRAVALARTGAWEAASAALREALRHGRSREPHAALATEIAGAHLRTALATASRDDLAAADHALAAWDLAPGRDTHDAAWKLCVSVGPGWIGPRIDPARLQPLLTASHAGYAAWIAQGNLLRRAGTRNAAEAAYRRAHTIWPQAPFAAERLASLFAEGGRFAAADALFVALGRAHGGREAIIRLDPGFLAALGAHAPPPDLPVDAVATETGTAPPWVVMAGADGAYFARFGARFARSVRARCGVDGVLHLHLVHPAPEHLAALAALRAELAPLRVEWTIERPDLPSAPEARRTYYACARFLRLPQLLRRHRAPLVVLDIDSEVLRDLAPLTAQVIAEGADLGMIVGDPGEVWGSCWADHVALAPTPRAAEFAALVAAYIRHFLAAGRYDWFLDQIALYAVRHVGFAGRAAPRCVTWPADIQNAGPESYVWSMHMSQPANHARGGVTTGGNGAG
jgi:tetratricopeptide (TPR) repeat protein